MMPTDSDQTDPDRPSPLRDVPFMGVIWVVHQASKRGFVNGHPDWCNLGQGQPEVGQMAGAPPRVTTIELDPADHAYGPLGGTVEVRTAIAEHYNRLYRGGKSTQYGPDNVAVAMGGRLALSRSLCALAPLNIGYQLPDYTAYEDMLDLHLSRLTPVPLVAAPENGFTITAAQFDSAVCDAGLSAMILSNPCNPTGRVIAGDELQSMLDTARRRDCLLLMDEFYSHFIYEQGADGRWGPGAGPISMAALIDDVESDPVLMFDGLTKNHRYPGWRVGWIVGPKQLVQTVERVASALDGGPSRVTQRAALAALEPDVADQETAAVREVFAEKRNVMVAALTEIGVTFAAEPNSTFYAWGCLSRLPAPLNDAKTFFWRALDCKVLTVPGEFFDVNPGKRRHGRSRFEQWMRFSFGPPMDNMVMGLERLAEMVSEAR